MGVSKFIFILECYFKRTFFVNFFEHFYFFKVQHPQFLGLKSSSLNDPQCTFSSTCNSKILTRALLNTIISFNIMLCFGQKSILILLTHQRKVADQISFTLIQIITLQWTLFNYTIVLALSNFSNVSFKKGSLFYNIFHFHICSVFIFQFDLMYIAFCFWGVFMFYLYVCNN